MLSINQIEKDRLIIVKKIDMYIEENNSSVEDACNVYDFPKNWYMDYKGITRDENNESIMSVDDIIKDAAKNDIKIELEPKITKFEDDIKLIKQMSSKFEYIKIKEKFTSLIESIIVLEKNIDRDKMFDKLSPDDKEYFKQKLKDL